MFKLFCLTSILSVALTFPACAAPEQVWQDIPAQAHIAMGFDWAPGQWDLLTQQPAVQKLLTDAGKQFDTDLLTNLGFEIQDFRAHFGTQMALAVHFDFEREPWLVASFALSNEAAVRTLLARYVAEKKLQRQVLNSGIPVFVVERERSTGKTEWIVLQVADGRLRVVSLSEMGLLEQLLDGPSLWPKVQARIKAHPEKGLWFVGEPQHFHRLTAILFRGVGAKPLQHLDVNPLIVGIGLDANGLYGQAWQHEPSLTGAPLDLMALAPLIPADSFFFHAFTLKTPLIEPITTLGEHWGTLFWESDLKRWHQFLEQHMGIDWPRLLMGLNGQMAWSATLSTDAEDLTPTWQAYLGTSQPQQSYQALKAMQFNSQLFTELMTGPRLQATPGESVRENAQALQTMVEIFLVDHGLYPEDLTSLMEEAKSSNYYWKELINPITKQSGIGKALDSFHNFKRQGFPPSSAGQVFYEPLGQRKSLNSDGPQQGGYPGYRIYIYLEDGSVDVLTHDEHWNLQTPLLLKPWKKNIGPSPRITWGISRKHPPLVRLVNSLDDEDAPALWLDEYARFLRLSNRSESLMGTRTQSAFPISKFQAVRGHSTPHQIMYIHIPKLLSVGKLPSTTTVECIQGVEDFILEESVIAEDSHASFRLNVDMSNLDVAAMILCMKKESEIYENRHNFADLRISRKYLHGFIEIVSAYNSGYPISVEMLSEKVTDSIANPITGTSGIGPRGALIDYAEFEKFSLGTLPGMIVYQPILTEGNVVGYKLYMTDHQGQLLLDENGQPDVLLNETDNSDEG